MNTTKYLGNHFFGIKDIDKENIKVRKVVLSNIQQDKSTTTFVFSY